MLPRFFAALACCLPLSCWTPAQAADVTTVRIAQLQIKPECLHAFTLAVREGMEAALRTEPGVLAIYAVADKNDPTRLTFFEMYADDAAYERHRQTPHFQKYFHTTKSMIASRVLHEALPVELRDKHNTPARPGR
ncbi:putative quinol monooxygenase [uncultured Desulfovibrio sp.]|uniref:putative quinol monooxygenase n=1 Tax=uncultured Desulfovibrio sp. TaxID=167968 RepID=UPI002631EE41|nr:putative quinol monooxygenase [uncultured Desulfovibrio sp.]